MKWSMDAISGAVGGILPGEVRTGALSGCHDDRRKPLELAELPRRESPRKPAANLISDCFFIGLETFFDDALRRSVPRHSPACYRASLDDKGLIEMVHAAPFLAGHDDWREPLDRRTAATRIAPGSRDRQSSDREGYGREALRSNVAYRRWAGDPALGSSRPATSR